MTTAHRDPRLEPAPAPSPAAEPGWLRVLWTAACRVVLALVGSLLVWTVLSTAWGWSPEVIMSGSMTPRIGDGDVLVIRPVAADQLRSGQVVTVDDPDHPGRTRTHRFLQRDEDGDLVLVGDANAAADSAHVAPTAVHGVAVLRVPYIGHAAVWWQRQAWVRLGVLAVVAGALVLGGKGGGGRDDDRGDGRPGPPRPTRRRRWTKPRRRQVIAVVAAGVLTLAGSGSAQAAFKKTTANTSNAWNAASNFYPYQTAVVADTPYLYWRLQETSGTAIADTSINNRGATSYNTPALAQSGPILGEPRDVALGTGTNGLITQNGSQTTPSAVSIEAWVKTTTTNGGRLIGFGDGATNMGSTTVDCHLYLGTDGKVRLGLGSGKTALASAAAVNNGSWHHVVGTYSAGTGAKIYLDGSLSATGSGAAPQSFTGYWRAGAEALSGWPSNPTSNYLVGTIDEIAVDTSVWSAARVTAHYNAGVTP